MKKIKGFTLIELLVVTVIVGILSALSVPQMSKYNSQAGDTWRQSLVKNVSKILMADEFVSLDGVNFADLDGDNNYLGNADPVVLDDVTLRLKNQDYILSTENQGACVLYGYKSSGTDHAEMLIVTNKDEETGTGEAGFIFDGTDASVREAGNITAVSCVSGSEGVTGGTWTGYYWLNLIP